MFFFLTCEAVKDALSCHLWHFKPSMLCHLQQGCKYNTAFYLNWSSCCAWVHRYWIPHSVQWIANGTIVRKIGIRSENSSSGSELSPTLLCGEASQGGGFFCFLFFAVTWILLLQEQEVQVISISFSEKNAKLDIYMYAQDLSVWENVNSTQWKMCCLESGGENKAEDFGETAWARWLSAFPVWLPTAPSCIIYSHLFWDIYARVVSLRMFEKHSKWTY